MNSGMTSGLERKFCSLGDVVETENGTAICGYASLFGKADQGGDAVQAGAYAKSLAAMASSGRRS